MVMGKCVFCGIVSGKIPAQFVYQDGEMAVFHDISKSAPVHLLLVSKKHVEDLTEADDGLILAIKNRIKILVEGMDLIKKGYRVVVNGGSAKAVPHLHFHLLGEVGVERKV